MCCHFINTDLKSDLEKFAMISEPTEHDFDEVKKIKSDIQTTPTHRLHKMLTLFRNVRRITSWRVNSTRVA